MYGYSGTDCGSTNAAEGTPALTTPKATNAPLGTGSYAKNISRGMITLVILFATYLN